MMGPSVGSSASVAGCFFCPTCPPMTAAQDGPYETGDEATIHSSLVARPLGRNLFCFCNRYRNFVVASARVHAGDEVVGVDVM